MPWVPGRYFIPSETPGCRFLRYVMAPGVPSDLIEAGVRAGPSIVNQISGQPVEVLRRLSRIEPGGRAVVFDIRVSGGRGLANVFANFIEGEHGARAFVRHDLAEPPSFSECSA